MQSNGSNRKVHGMQRLLFGILGIALLMISAQAQPMTEEYPSEIHIPSLVTDHNGVNRAFRIAVGDLMGNVARYRNGLLEQESLVILAGLDYDTPWTRDAAINAWNGASLIMPEISKNTLLSVLDPVERGVRIGGEYWDAIVWATGAWSHFLYTGDNDFLSLALKAVRNSLIFFESTEFDPATGLFRGPGWSDGVAAYPDIYTSGMASGIASWPKAHPDLVAKPGVGIPMQAISTNCLYYNSYRVAGNMAEALGVSAEPAWAEKADKLKAAINERLWMPDKGYYRFFIDPFGGCDHQEALGHAYAILFGIADPAQTESIFKTLHVAKAGVPCVWPTFARYENKEGTAYGRHSGTVWPQIQGFWAEAAARQGKTEVFAHELFRLTEHAVRDLHFAELYHPDTGAVYGGMQEAGKERGIALWNATSRQTWAATAYLRMILFGVAGMRFDTSGVRFQPCLPEGLSKVALSNIHYRGMIVDLDLSGNGSKADSCSINGENVDKPFLKADGTGKKLVAIAMK